MGARRAGRVVEEAVAGVGRRFLGRCAGAAGVEAVARAERHQGDGLARHVEGEQVQQVAVAAGGGDLEAAHAVARLAAVDRLDAAEVGDLLEQLDQVVGHLGLFQRADAQLEHARAAGGGRCGRRGRRLACRGGGDGRRLHRRGQRLAGGQRADVEQQLGGVDLRAARALVARQLGAQRVARGEQHVDHLGGRRKLVAAQLVQQRLHLVRQLGHVHEAEGRGAALDGVRAAEDRVQLLVVGGRDVHLEQQLFHALEVLAGLLEEDLVELAQVDAGAGVRAFRSHLAHGVVLPWFSSCSPRVFSG